MNQETLVNKMSELKLEGFKTAYLRQVEDRNYDRLSFNEKLYNLLESQDIFQHNRKIQMNFRMSKIKDKQASLEDREKLSCIRRLKTIHKALMPSLN